jgi:hypothetical protein
MMARAHHPRSHPVVSSHIYPRADAGREGVSKMSDATLPQTTAPTATTNHTGRRTARYAGYVFWVMFVANFTNYLDRFIFAGISPYIQRDLGFNDAQLGLLGSVFFLVYTLFALPFGFFAERIARKTIVGAGMVIAGVATILTGVFPELTALIGVKALFGFGQSGFYPAGTPFLAAQFPPSQRARVIGRWGVGAVIGAALGYLLAGFFKAPFAWRTALFVTGVPAILVAVFVLLLREKRRHEADPAVGQLAGTNPSSLQRVRGYLRIPTFRVILATHALAFFALTGITFWLPIYLQDTYGQYIIARDASGNRLGTQIPSYFGSAGLDPGLIPIVAGGLVLLGGLFGNLYGPRLAARLSRRRAGARVLASGIGFLLAAPCLVLSTGTALVLPQIPLYTSLDILAQRNIGVAIFAVFALLASFFLNVYNGPMSAALLDVLPPSERSAAGGAELTFAHLLGDVYATFAIGALSVFLSVQLGGEQIGLALLLTTPVTILGAAIVSMWGSRFYARDVAKLGTTAEAMLGTAPVAAPA